MSKRRSLFAPIVIEGLDSHENALRTEAHIAERIAAAEVARRLARALEQVPEILSKTYELRVLLGLSTEETARRLGVTLYVVRTRLPRARIALRRLSSH